MCGRKVGGFMKFKLNQYHRNISKDDLIEDLRTVAEKHFHLRLRETSTKEVTYLNYFNKH